MLASSPNICGVQYCRLLSAMPRYHVTKQHFRESMPGIISIRDTIVFWGFFWPFSWLYWTDEVKRWQETGWEQLGGGGHAASVHVRTQHQYMRGHIYACEDANICTWGACSTSWAIGTPLETTILSFEYTCIHEYVFQKKRLPKQETLKKNKKYRSDIPAPHLYEPCTNTSGCGFLTSVFSFTRVRPPKNIINLEWFPPSCVEINSR